MNAAIINDIKYAVPVTVAEGIYLINTNDTVERITEDESLWFQTLRLYPAKAVSDGVLTANGADIYLGRSTTYLPDKRTVADVDYPVLYELPAGSKMQLCKIYVKGQSTDGVFYSYT